MERLSALSSSQWRRLLPWLDTSGLALPFFDRLGELSATEVLPAPVRHRLAQNLEDNRARTAALIAEWHDVHLRFERAGLSYCTVKGFSLWPVSVPKPELRSQLDLDFLIAEGDAPRAREILEEMGYRLQAISGVSWEFKYSSNLAPTLKDLYQPFFQRSIELHLEVVNREAASRQPENRGTANGERLEPAPAAGASRLARSEVRTIFGIAMPVLSPVDLFLGQGLHLAKHLCAEHVRTAHLVEFRRHVLARFWDYEFWMEVREMGERQPGTSWKLGFAIATITRVMGEFAPRALSCWTSDRLPASTRRWVEWYGPRAVFAGFPGTKLYLLLEGDALPCGPMGRSRLQSLVPHALPAAIEHPAAGETAAERAGRYYRRLRFYASRFRFHSVEGLRFVYETARWSRGRRSLRSL
ncbi:MAG TPA: nucleotidyltransferase family protein [Acidisarcina sp.]